MRKFSNGFFLFFLVAKKRVYFTYDVIYLIWVEKLTDELKATPKLPIWLIEKLATKADALTGKVSFIALSLGFVTVNQIREKYYNVFEQLCLHHSLLG